MQELHWTQGEGEAYYDAHAQAKIDWLANKNEPGGYQLNLTRRPVYCDRGDWLLRVDPVNLLHPTLDDQDGFPRYFFGSLEEAKDQFFRWVNRREELQ